MGRVSKPLIRTFVVTCFDPSDGEYVEIVRAGDDREARRLAVAGRPSNIKVIGAKADLALSAILEKESSDAAASVKRDDQPTFPRQTFIASSADVRRVRRALGISQAAFAKRIGVSGAVITYAEQTGLYLVPARRNARRCWREVAAEAGVYCAGEKSRTLMEG